MSILNLKISTKLPITIVALAVLSAGVAGYMGFKQSESALEKSALEKINTAHEGRIYELTSWLDSIKEDILTVSTNDMSINMLDETEAAWQELGNGRVEKLQKMYITDNPNPGDEKYKLDAAPEDLAYNNTHARYHPWFRQFLMAREYSDIFLIDDNGNVVYSVHKELDFATNLKNGQWKDTNLAKVYRMVEDNYKPGYVAFTDFSSYAPSGGGPASFIASPVFDRQGKRHGVLVFQMPVSRLNSIMQQSTGMGATGESYLVGADLTMRSTSRFTRKGETDILKTKADSKGVRKALAGKKDLFMTIGRTGKMAMMATAPLDFLGVRWAVITDIDMEEVDRPAIEMRNNIIIATLLLSLVVAVIGFFFARSISSPIGSMTGAMASLADGDLETEIPSRERVDEIGDMASTVQVFKDNAIKVKQMEAEAEEMKRRAEEEKKAIMHKLADDFEGNVGGVVQAVSSASTELQSSAESMSATAEQTNRQSTAVAAASEEASTNVQTVASAAEELSSSISEISRQVSQSAEIASRAVNDASATDEKIQGLAIAAQKIGEVVALITDIADQTNLLALNATIEAARAGDAGKGFAVVASEVKNLASQTARATEEIGAQISGIQTATQDSVEAIQGIGKTIGEIDEIAAAIAAAVEQQGAATQEIARNVEQAAAGTNEVSSNIAGVTQAAGETGQAAIQIQTAAKELSQQSEMLKVEVDKFLDEIRLG